MNLHTLSLLLTALPPSLATITSQYLGGPYPGWPSISTIFAFGDSYTDTDFSISQPPTPQNPTGATYPPSDAFKSDKWITYLTTHYNASGILTYNLARNGAVVSRALFGDDPKKGGLSMRDEIYDIFASVYAIEKDKLWEPDSTLFAIFIGINDCNEFASNTTFRAKMDDVLAHYEDQLTTLFEAGAKHFLFISVPALYRGPDHPNQELRTLIPAFNARVLELAKRIVRCGASAHFLDTEALFNDAMTDPARYPETVGIRETRVWCKDYATSDKVLTPGWRGDGLQCKNSYEAMWWRDGLHVGMKPQMLIAGAAARGMGWDGSAFQGGEGTGLVRQQAVKESGRYIRWRS